MEEDNYRTKSHVKPLWYCTVITKYPWTAFGLTLSGHLSLTLLNLILLACGYNIFPVDFNVFPVQLTGDLVAQREYAWRYRDIDPGHIDRIIIDDLGPTWERGYTIDEIKIFFTDNDKNLFTKESLNVIQAIEQNMINEPEYQRSFCPLDATRSCIRPTSVLRYFDGTYIHISETFYDPYFDNITKVIYEAYTNPETAYDFLYFLGKGYHITEDVVFVDLTRISIPLGWPLEGNQTADEKQKIVDDFVRDYVKPNLEFSKLEFQEEIELCYISNILFGIDIMPQVLRDFLLAIGSLTFIFCFIWFVTRSLWIPGWAVLSIVTCVFITNLIYRVICDYIYLGFFHVISIFIILGIGADDLFVYYNSWRTTGLYIYPSVAHRMSDAYRRSAATMFFTSFTTMMAFLSGGLSPILPLGSFGIFTGILIGVNYISVIVFFPTVVYTHHLYFSDKNKNLDNDDKIDEICLNGTSSYEINAGYTMETNLSDNILAPVSNINNVFNGKIGSEENSMYHEVTIFNSIKDNKLSSENMSNTCTFQTENIVKNNGITQENLYGKNDCLTMQVDNSSTDNIIKGPPVSKEKPNAITLFFTGKYFDIITNKVVRWIILLGFLGLVGFLCWSATNIQVDSEEIKIYKENTNYGQAMRYSGSGFVPSGDSYVELNIVWGMEPRDYSMCHKTDYKCSGVQVWDDGFDMNTPTAQLALHNLCYKLKFNLTEEELELLMIRSNTETRELMVDCFMDDLNKYMMEEGKRLNMTQSMDFPLKESNIYEYMAIQPGIYEDTMDISFYRYFEIGLSNWINNQYMMVSTPDYIIYNSLLGENTDGINTKPVLFHQDIFNQTLGYYGTKLRYAAIRVNLSLSTQELGYQTGLPVRDNWEIFLKQQLSEMPVALQNAFQVTHITWHWLTIQKTLVYNAALGIILGISIALPILILATMNWIVGFLATLNIMMITICVLGVIPLAGWKLDVMISMNLCLLVGLSIDYVVHIAEGYHLSPHISRKLRVKDTLEHLGVSVLSGAGTTLGAAFFMMFAKIQFFLQFGTFLLSTIGFSLLFSIVFLPTLFSTFGPEGDTGSIIPPFRWIWYSCIGRSTNDKDCYKCNGKGFVHSEDNEADSPENHELIKEPSSVRTEETDMPLGYIESIHL